LFAYQPGMRKLPESLGGALAPSKQRASMRRAVRKKHPSPVQPKVGRLSANQILSHTERTVGVPTSLAGQDGRMIDPCGLELCGIGAAELRIIVQEFVRTTSIQVAKGHDCWQERHLQRQRTPTQAPKLRLMIDEGRQRFALAQRLRNQPDLRFKTMDQRL